MSTPDSVIGVPGFPSARVDPESDGAIAETDSVPLTVVGPIIPTLDPATVTSPFDVKEAL